MIKKAFRWLARQAFVFWMMPFMLTGVFLASLVHGFHFGMWLIADLIDKLTD